jgi:Ran GTPase-activating protein (RanGAP) involved in mRNA processing and transport
VGLLSINELLFKSDALKFLDVGGNRYDWDGIISLMNALKTTNKSLEILNMDEPAYKITDQHFFNHIGKMFLSNTTLRKLSLKFNKLRWEGLNIIIFSLSKNTTLTVLDLTGNQICFQGMIYVRDYLKDNNILKSLILCGNKLRDQGAKVLVDGLVPNKTLIHLDITNNDIGEQGFIDFGNKIKENTGIKSLKLFRDNHWEKIEKKDKHEKTNDAIEILDKYLKIKGKDFYPDFTIYEDADELNIAYLETHIPNEINYIIDS